jgi:hypothetical protein
MPDYSFGSPSNVLSFVLSGEGPTTTDMPLPVGRPANDGARLALLTGVQFYATGRGGSRTGRAYVAGRGTSQITIPSGSSAAARGMIGIENPLLVNGGTTSLRLDFAPCYFGYGGSGSTNDGTGRVLSGMLAGNGRFEQPPDSPTLISLESSADGKMCAVRFTFQGDVGDTAILGYRVQWATNSSFTSGVGTFDVSNGQPNIYGLTPGVRYWWRITARNRVTDLGGKLGGGWSNVAALTQNKPEVVPDPDPEPDPIRVGRSRTAGGSWSQAQARIRSGTVWRPADARIWNAGAWRKLG